MAHFIWSILSESWPQCTWSWLCTRQVEWCCFANRLESHYEIVWAVWYVCNRTTRFHSHTKSETIYNSIGNFESLEKVFVPWNFDAEFSKHQACFLDCKWYHFWKWYPPSTWKADNCKVVYKPVFLRLTVKPSNFNALENVDKCL